MIKTVAGLEALDLSFFRMKMMQNVQRKQWMERSDIKNTILYHFLLNFLLKVMFSLQALLGRPLRISIALEKARGVPVVVPRLSDIGHLNRR